MGQVGSFMKSTEAENPGYREAGGDASHRQGRSSDMARIESRSSADRARRPRPYGDGLIPRELPCPGDGIGPGGQLLSEEKRMTIDYQALATDYDSTVATEGTVAADVLDGLRRF